MNTPTPLLSDLLAMTAMRIASNGRVITRVTAELELSRVTGEYLAGFAYDLNPIERERVAREIKLDLNNLRQTRSYVVCEATERHPDYLLSSPLLRGRLRQRPRTSGVHAHRRRSSAPPQLQPGMVAEGDQQLKAKAPPTDRLEGPSRMRRLQLAPAFREGVGRPRQGGRGDRWGGRL